MSDSRVIAGTKLTPAERDELDKIIVRLGAGNRSAGLRLLVRMTIAANELLEDK